jgi:Ca2+-binding EF-hand superfamily protein
MMKVFDKNGDGYITKDELKQAMAAMGNKLTGTLYFRKVLL